MKTKSIKLASMVFFGIGSVLVLYTVPASASMGLHGIGVWVLMIPLFLLPSCFVVAELGSTWAENGGIYIWTKRAFGEGLASQVSWLYWANTLFTSPLASATLIGVLCSYFLPGASNITQMILVIVVIWFVSILGIMNTQATQKATSYGGTVVLVLLGLLAVGGIASGIKSGLATPITFEGLMPNMSLFIAFGPIVIFNVLGLELLSSVANRMDNPKKNVPKFIIIAGLLIAALYIFGSWAVTAVIPVANINSVSGMVDAVTAIVNNLFGSNFAFIAMIFVIASLYAMLASGIAWALGSSYVISTTGLDQRSKILGHYSKKFGTPDSAYIISAIVGTIYVLFNYLGGDSVQSIFWVIFSFSSMVYLAPYVLMFPAVIKLRYKEPNTERPYKIPGGKIGLWVFGLLPTLGTIFAIIGFALPKDPTIDVLPYELKMWGGFALVVLIGVVIYFNSKRRAKKEAKAVAATQLNS